MASRRAYDRDDQELLELDRVAFRDLEREPAFRPRARHDLRVRRAFQAGVIDSINRAFDADETALVLLRCPLCSGPVYAPHDTADERVDCSGCGAVLTARHSLYHGGPVVELDAGVSAPMPDGEP